MGKGRDVSRKDKKDELQRVLCVGQRMSNVMFNYKQNDKTPDDLRRLMAELQSEWDTVLRLYKEGDR